ncbi:MAG: hypothetical protein OXG16_09080 [Rhodospirillales bacterium]|nr:hypothetical protein [Rhodospirillales bacterium]
MTDGNLELVEGGEAVILDSPNVPGEEIVGLLLSTKTVELAASDLPPEANLRIAFDPEEALRLAQSLYQAAREVLKGRQLH